MPHSSREYGGVSCRWPLGCGWRRLATRIQAHVTSIKAESGQTPDMTKTAGTLTTHSWPLAIWLRGRPRSMKAAIEADGRVNGLRMGISNELGPMADVHIDDARAMNAHCRQRVPRLGACVRRAPWFIKERRFTSHPWAISRGVETGGESRGDDSAAWEGVQCGGVGGRPMQRRGREANSSGVGGRPMAARWR
jgi:hypothetical protein